MRWLPRLRWAHPNLFVALTVTALFHLVFGLMHLLMPEQFDAPHFRDVFLLLPQWLWGLKGVVIFLAIVYAMWTEKYMVARGALVVGMFFAIARGLLIELAPERVGAGGVVIWLFVAIMHWVQMSEPSTNPITGKE